MHTKPTELLLSPSQNYWQNCFPSHTPIHPYPPLPKDTDPPPQPADHYAYLRLLGILLNLTKSRPDIMAAVSFAGTRSSNPTDRDLSDLCYVVEYLRATQDMGHILHKSTIRIYSEVDASYLLHFDSKGHSAPSMAPLAHSTTAALTNKQHLLHTRRSPCNFHTR